MECPVCREPLIVAEREGIELDVCPWCHGLWFDAGELALLAEKLGRTLAAPEGAPLEAAPASEKPRLCPRCDKAMDKVALGTRPKVLLDRCASHGLWFDHGELGSLVGQLSAVRRLASRGGDDVHGRDDRRLRRAANRRCGGTRRGGQAMIFGFVVLIVIVVAVIWVMGMYNGLVGSRNEVKNAWSQIDVQLKRRHDLIPNLVETVKGYMGHERGTLEAVTNARQQAVNVTGGVEDRAKAENALSQTLRSLFAVAEAYPDLKANQNFLALQEELTSTENKISFARQYYNDAVLRLNNRIQMFPSNIIAGMFNFSQEKFFEVEAPEERQVPQVKF